MFRISSVVSFFPNVMLCQVMSTQLNSTQVKLRNCKVVKDILDKYHIFDKDIHKYVGFQSSKRLIKNEYEEHDKHDKHDKHEKYKNMENSKNN